MSNSSNFTLWYWLRGPRLSTFSCIRVSSDADVFGLKMLSDVRPVDFEIYKVPEAHPVPLLDERVEDTLGKLTISCLGSPLLDAARLSSIFTSKPKEDHLHLIFNCCSTLSLQCWIRGDEPANSFPVDISIGASVDGLKNAVKASCGDLAVIPLNRLKLYKVPVIEDALGPQGSGRLLQGHEWVERVFDDVPFSQRPRIVIEPVARPRHPSSTAPAPSYKRERSEDALEANSGIHREFVYPLIRAPSATGFPLVLAHRIFATFVSECDTYVPTADDLDFVSKLSDCMCQLFEDETDRRTQFRACMKGYGIDLTEANVEGNEYTVDGEARVGALPYLISGVKRAFGADANKEDAYVQAAAYHQAATLSWRRANPDDVRALPCMFIFYNGPFLGFAGSMAFDVNILGPLLPLCHHRLDVDTGIQCAKMFGALKHSAAALKDYYAHTPPQSCADTRFPWITQYDTLTTPPETREYTYVRRMDGSNVLFLCEHVHDGTRLLVKFVQRYALEAHRLLAAHDGAPALLGHRDVLACGWSVVAMAWLEGPAWMSGAEVVYRPLQDTVRAKVRAHVSTLHQHGFVHGDVRPQNVLLRDLGDGQGLSVYVLDFDWAGKANEVRYPFFVNPDLGHGFERPSGVKGGSVITMEHDLAMLKLFYPHSDECMVTQTHSLHNYL